MNGYERSEGLTPWVRRLIVANLIVFLLQKTVFYDQRFLDAVGFVPDAALRHPWTFVTYLFVHGGILHLAFNLLALYMFGPPVEARMGGGRFLGYYLACGFGGALLSFVLQLVVPVHVIVGASGAILGVAVAFAWYWPDAPVIVFPFPQPFAAKWLVVFTVAISLVLAMTGAGDGVAHLAHLGGVGTGLLILKAQDLQSARHERTLRREVSSVVVQPAALALRGSDPARKPPRPSRSGGDRTQAEVDRVLDKISARGINSLTPAERKFLAEMSRKMRDRP
ncbi:MAG TPA: rhomboid family intramembrane serine protease [Gemmatimonadales bacterium]|nr:rhomboid family intramembrane serine protease [Gemmatimonadales bacterium]